MNTRTRTLAAVAVGRLDAGGFNSGSFEDALAAPRKWEDAHPLMAQTDGLVVESWDGPEGDKLIKFEDQSYVYFFGCTGGAQHFDTPMDLAFSMPNIEKERAEWKLSAWCERHENGVTMHFCGSMEDDDVDPNVANNPLGSSKVS